MMLLRSSYLPNLFNAWTGIYYCKCQRLKSSYLVSLRGEKLKRVFSHDGGKVLRESSRCSCFRMFPWWIWEVEADIGKQILYWWLMGKCMPGVVPRVEISVCLIFLVEFSAESRNNRRTQLQIFFKSLNVGTNSRISYLSMYSTPAFRPLIFVDCLQCFLPLLFWWEMYTETMIMFLGLKTLQRCKFSWI